MDRVDLAVLGGLVTVVIVVPALFWNRLPDPTATHFGLSGRPDGSLPRIAWLLIIAVVLGMCWVIHLRSRSNAPLTWQGPVTFGIFGVILVAQLSIIWSNFDAPTWRDARAVSVPLLLGAMAAAWVALGAFAFMLERR